MEFRTDYKGYPYRIMVKIPRVFWEDCKNCDCDVGEEQYGTKRHVWVCGFGDQFQELIDRAEMYSDVRNGYWESCRGLVLSARATLKAIKEAA